MKIIVNNEYEAKLMENFLLAVHELGMIDELEKEDHSVLLKDRFLDGEDYRILSEAVFHDQTKIVIDKSEPELHYEDSAFVTGTCIHCGIETSGLSDPVTITYADYLHMMTPEAMKTWRCEECRSRLCPCCSENLIDDADEDECTKCISENNTSKYSRRTG